MAQAATVSSVVRMKVATPERWQRALQRARFARVEAKQIAGSGEWIVRGASRPGIAYRTDGISCNCEATMLGRDPVCLHRAAYWFALGVLELDPEPDTPALGTSVDCRECHGCGVIYDKHLERTGWLYPPCVGCHGTGTVLGPETWTKIAPAA